MRVVYVADFEGSAVTRQTARTECRKTALVRQLRKRVCLIHELRQRRRTEKLLNSRNDRTDIDKVLRREIFGVLHGHALFDKLFHTGKADAHLILQKLADAAESAVAEVVDIVHRAAAVCDAEHIVDRRVNIVVRDVLGNKLHAAAFEFRDKRFFVVGRSENFLQNVNLHLFVCL